MNWRVSVFALVLCLCGSRSSRAQEQPVLLPGAPKPQKGDYCRHGKRCEQRHRTWRHRRSRRSQPERVPRTVLSNDNGFFQFDDVESGTYQVMVGAQGFADWTSSAIILKPGQYEIVTGSKLHIAEALTTITVAAAAASPEEIAAEQVKAEEQQRILGFIPNFCVVL